MSWNGVKQQSYEQEVKSWCEEMYMRNYTINSKGEIDVDGNINLRNKNFEELPYKFGRVTGFFDVGNSINLTSLKNCPNEVGNYFRCSYCPKLESLEGCPKVVSETFYCSDCKGEFTEKEIKSLCEAKGMYFQRYVYIK